MWKEGSQNIITDSFQVQKDTSIWKPLTWSCFTYMCLEDCPTSRTGIPGLSFVLCWLCTELRMGQGFLLPEWWRYQLCVWPTNQRELGPSNAVFAMAWTPCQAPLLVPSCSFGDDALDTVCDWVLDIRSSTRARCRIQPLANSQSYVL